MGRNSPQAWWHTRLSEAKTVVFKTADTRPAKPEEQELALKLEEQAALEAELADRELRSANLRAELAAFERRYLHFVGSRYAELDEWKAQIAERLVAEQPGNERARQAASEARARATETKAVAGEKSAQEPRSFHASAELKSLYRELARRVHPDLTADRDDRAKRQSLMAEVNQAYERGDQARLEKILTAYEHSPEAVQGEGPGAELVRVIRRVSQARGRLGEIEAELQGLLRSDLHQLKARVDEAEKSGHDVLNDMIAKVDEQIALAKERLKVPAGLPR
ncbi:MAG TPA: J domain-containing protein [Candidatus Cybelea sp.]|nr:J domain-containing protein [Candidatus Cybelea sp.]